MKLSNEVLETILVKAAISGPTNDFNENLLIIRNGILADELIRECRADESDHYVMIRKENIEDILRLFEVREVEARNCTSDNSDTLASN